MGWASRQLKQSVADRDIELNGKVERAAADLDDMLNGSSSERPWSKSGLFKLIRYNQVPLMLQSQLLLNIGSRGTSRPVLATKTFTSRTFTDFSGDGDFMYLHKASACWFTPTHHPVEFKMQLGRLSNSTEGDHLATER